MRETSKCHLLRAARGDFENYLNGDILDVGCGPDPLKPPQGVVRPWDLTDGDASYLQTIPDRSFDSLYSSHCLEHLPDLKIALANWVRVVKDGGWIYITIPDYTLYEKERWPSRFNSDHKCSFSISKTRDEVGRDSHFNIKNDLDPIMVELGCRLVRVELEDVNYNYGLPETDQTIGKALAQICCIWFKKHGF